MESIPSNSKILSYTTDAYFTDCFASKIRYEKQSALDLFLLIAKETPSWINVLMSLRNNVVSKLGLKDLGKIADIELSKPGPDYRVGERVGIFTLYSNNHNEVILEDQDKHLNVKISFYVEPSGDTAKIHATTVVHVKNTSGKIYMFFVEPIHKIIVPSILKQLPQA